MATCKKQNGGDDGDGDYLRTVEDHYYVDKKDMRIVGVVCVALVSLLLLNFFLPSEWKGGNSGDNITMLSKTMASFIVVQNAAVGSNERDKYVQAHAQIVASTLKPIFPCSTWVSIVVLLLVVGVCTFILSSLYDPNLHKGPTTRVSKQPLNRALRLFDSTMIEAHHVAVCYIPCGALVVWILTLWQHSSWRWNAPYYDLDPNETGGRTLLFCGVVFLFPYMLYGLIPKSRGFLTKFMPLFFGCVGMVAMLNCMWIFTMMIHDFEKDQCARRVAFVSAVHDADTANGIVSWLVPLGFMASPHMGAASAAMVMAAAKDLYPTSQTQYVLDLANMEERFYCFTHNYAESWTTAATFMVASLAFYHHRQNVGRQLKNIPCQGELDTVEQMLTVRTGMFLYSQYDRYKTSKQVMCGGTVLIMVAACVPLTTCTTWLYLPFPTTRVMMAVVIFVVVVFTFVSRLAMLVVKYMCSTPQRRRNTQ